MAGDGDLRVGPWAPAPGDTPGEPPATGPVTEEGRRNWWDDIPDPWDRPYQSGDPADDEDPTSDIRQGGPEAIQSKKDKRRRLAAVVVVFGAVLLGTGGLAKVLAPEPEAALAPPPTPPAQVATSEPDSITDLGLAPTAGPSPGRSPDRPATGAPPQGDRTPAPTPTTAPATAPATASYEAEDAEFSGPTRTYSEEEASGGAAVEMDTAFFGLLEGRVRFDEVMAEEAGQHELTVHYLSGRDGSARIAVNGARSTTVDFPEVESESPVGTVSLPVDLVAGENTIVFARADGSAPDLDRIDISR